MGMGMGLGISPLLLRRSGGDTRTYAQTLVEDYGANEVWPLVDIATGTAIHAHVNGNRDGSLVGWDLQNAAGPVSGTQAPFIDGVNDYGNIYTSNGTDGLADIFDGQEGSLFIWAKVNSASVWSDSTVRYLVHLFAGSQDFIYIRKDNTENKLRLWYEANNAANQSNIDLSTTDWFSAGISWSLSAGADGEVKFFINGSQVGSTLTAIGSFSGSLNSTNCGLGSRTGNAANDVFHGYLAYPFMKFGSIWTPTQFQEMHDAASTAGAD